MTDKEDIKLFLAIGLDQKRAEDTTRNEKLSSALKSLIQLGSVSGGCDKRIGNALYTVATKFPAFASAHISFIVPYLTSEKISLPQQLTALNTYLEEHGKQDKLDKSDFEKATGVGAQVSPEQIKKKQLMIR